MKCEPIVEASAKEVEISNHCEGENILPSQLGKTKEPMSSSGHEYQYEESSGDLRPTPRHSPGADHPRQLIEDSDDFGPTTPGRSPGAGHPRQLIGDSDDFGPTTPGRSPGAGHKRRLEDSGDFGPTTPGRSPGAGHGVALGFKRRMKLSIKYHACMLV